MIDRAHPTLSISRRCHLLEVSRTSVYRRPAPVSADDLRLIELIDRQYLARPYYGSRRMAAWLATQGHVVNRRAGGDLPATEYEQAGTGPQDLPLLARRDLDRAGQSGLVRGHHLHPDGPGLPLPGGDHGLGQPCVLA